MANTPNAPKKDEKDEGAARKGAEGTQPDTGNDAATPPPTAGEPARQAPSGEGNR